MRMHYAKRTSVFSEADYFFSIMLVGDSCCGKTCLLIRFNDGTFLNNNFISTVGIDYRNKLIDVDDVKVKLQIWDTAGQERFRSITSSYYRDADALLLVYDVANRESFVHVRDWLAQIQEYAKKAVLITLVGNKVDLHNERKVKYEEAKHLAETYNISFIETSAKTGHNVQETFHEISKRLIRASNGVDVTGGAVVDLVDEQPWKFQRCCSSS